MVQVIATIFFSAAAMSALGVIVGAFADDVAAIRTALGFPQPVPSLPSPRVQVRRIEPARGTAMALAASPLRAAA